MNIAVIGAGVAGLAAAHDLALAGHDVTLYEAAGEPGGLASGFRDPNWDWPLERFYHHWFQSDNDVLGLINEIGASNKVFFPRPITAMWHQGQAHPFDSPVAVLRYPGLSWPAKFRFGLAGLYLRFTGQWQVLERITVEEWATRWMGPEAYRRLWQPMLISKFGDYYRQVNMAWFWARIYKRSPRLGYFEGGFQGFVDVLVAQAVRHGAALRLRTPVKAITPDPDSGIVVHAGEELHACLILVETRRSFIHPGVPPLVDAYDHGDPHVGQLMGGDVVERAVTPVVVMPDEGHHGELHATTDDVATLDCAHVRPGVREPRKARQENRTTPRPRGCGPGPHRGTSPWRPGRIPRAAPSAC